MRTTTNQIDSEARVERHILLVDDHRIVADGVAIILEKHFSKVTTVNSASAMFDVLRSPDTVSAVVADLAMPGMDGIEALLLARKEGYSMPYIFLTVHDEPILAKRAMQFGANGYLLKTTASHNLIAAINACFLGEQYIDPVLAFEMVRIAGSSNISFSRSQWDVIERLENGLSAKQIAWDLGISSRTVEATKRHLMQMFDAHSSLELIFKLKKLGLGRGLGSWKIRSNRR